MESTGSCRGLYIHDIAVGLCNEAQYQPSASRNRGTPGKGVFYGAGNRKRSPKRVSLREETGDQHISPDYNTMGAFET